MRKIVTGLLLSVVLIGSALLIEKSIRLNRPLETGEAKGSVRPLPPVKFQRFPGNETVTFDAFKGKVVLINFWASWCEACMAEMPSIEKLYETLKSEGLEVIAVNVDDRPERVIPAVVSRLKLTFPIFTDKGGGLASAFGVAAIPFSVIADRKSRVVWAESGERDWSSEEVKSEIRKLLKR
jgi:thiol-disulfide isomerase/thioredoxin